MSPLFTVPLQRAARERFSPASLTGSWTFPFRKHRCTWAGTSPTAFLYVFPWARLSWIKPTWPWAWVLLGAWRGPGTQAGLVRHSAFSPKSLFTHRAQWWFGLLFPQNFPYTSSLQHSLIPWIKPGGPTQPITKALGVTASCSEVPVFSWERMPARCPHTIRRGLRGNGSAISSNEVPAQQLQPVQQMIQEGGQKKCMSGESASIREGTEGSFQLPWFSQSHPEVISAPRDKGVGCWVLPKSRQPAARRRWEAAGAAGTGDVLVCTLTEPGRRSTHAGVGTEVSV